MNGKLHQVNGKNFVVSWWIKPVVNYYGYRNKINDYMEYLFIGASKSTFSPLWGPFTLAQRAPKARKNLICKSDPLKGPVMDKV